MVLIDEAYAEFVDDPAAVHSLDFVMKYPNAVVTRTFSKAYGLAGIRVGYGIAQPELAEQITKAGLPFPVSLPYQQAAVEALSHPNVLQEHVQKVSAERAHLAKGLRALGAEVVEGYANFVWLPVGNMAQKIAELFRAEGVWVKPVMPHGVRITVGTPEESVAVWAAWEKLTPLIQE
jgi:histidinol-phosphate aminotransferase